MLRKSRFFYFQNKQNILFNFKSTRLKHEWIPPKGYDTGITVYSRIANKKVPLIFLNKNLVKWYICGPTVYDVSHIGHASCYVRLDIINRILRDFFDINPVVALGITDIDDKIIRESFKQKVDYRTLAKHHELEFLKQLKELNVLPPAFILRVSDHIPEIIEFISRIIDKGHAYPTEEGSVYFSSESSKNYGKLNPVPKKPSSPLKPGQRSFLDFALWKGAKEGEPYWESPWGLGRPGWHIECSAMSSKIFGSQLDLHSGGIDLVFPHHENEEAQSCSYHNCEQWVNYWLHSGELQVMDVKMSKSLRNFISIPDFLKTYTPDNLRMFCFISQYSRGLHYGSDALSLPISTCDIITKFLGDATAYVRGNWTKGKISESALLQDLEETKKEVREHLKNDFNTTGCYQSLMKLIANTVRMLNEDPDTSVGRCPAAVAAVSQYVSHVFKSFGFQLTAAPASQNVQDDQKLEFVLDQVVNFRNEVRRGAALCPDKSVKGDLYKACDALREDLQTLGVIIKDQGKDQATWSLVNLNKDQEKSEGVR